MIDEHDFSGNDDAEIHFKIDHVFSETLQKIYLDENDERIGCKEPKMLPKVFLVDEHENNLCNEDSAHEPLIGE